jgi:hypothetical protein
MQNHLVALKRHKNQIYFNIHQKMVMSSNLIRCTIHLFLTSCQ